MGFKPPGVLGLETKAYKIVEKAKIDTIMLPTYQRRAFWAMFMKLTLSEVDNLVEEIQLHKEGL